MRLFAAFALLFGLALASPAQAQAPADPATQAAARRYLELINVIETMKAVIPGARASMINVIARTNPGIVKEVEKAVDELLLPELVARLPELVDAFVQLYALHFTADELNRINAFYETPEGKKLAQKTPILTVQGQQIGGSWGQRVAIDAITKAAPKLRERGINL